MELGVIINLMEHPEEEFRKVNEFGFRTCQVNGWNQDLFTEEIANRVIASCQKYRVQITSFWCGWEGPAQWNFTEGPLTLGLVPPAFRHERLKMLMKGVDFAVSIGAPSLTTHVGFIPENPNDPEYQNLLVTLRHLVRYCCRKDIWFLFETGQETPVTLLRTIEGIGLDHIGINLDPANLILYGKANPVDALEIFGKYVKGVHAKDGLYPTSGASLGEEVRLGEGRVNFPALISRLKELGYSGSLTIEREISGEQQIQDILAAKKFLEALI